MQSKRHRVFLRAAMCGMLLALVACGGGEEEGASRIPPPPDQIVYDPSAFDDVADVAIRHYLQAADALAHDRFTEAQAALEAMAGAADATLKPLAANAAAATDIVGVRIAFKPLSDAVRQQPLPSGMATAYCPMAFDYEGGHWVQRDGPIMNPYFGASMLHCGVFEDEDESGA